ncbi:MAG: polysaccharide biosynthesis/export family protein [Planctomycetes bacterium]|nr:polysaccharide biosynthesis/export family protein [Planctomycetota bacterium]
MRRRMTPWWRCCAPILAFFAILEQGCTTTRTQIKQAIGGTAPPPVVREQTVEQTYRIGCPDIVEIVIEGVPDSSGQYVVSPEGRIALAAMENPRIEGDTTAALASRIATGFGIPEEQVRCKVVKHRSRSVFIFGPIEGGNREVLYRGSENVIGFIRRCGGLHPGADVRDIHVVRGNVARGEKPQVFAVDLEAILLRGDPQTNVLLQPFDEIHIGELPRSKIGKSLPSWLRPIYREFCGVFPGLCPHDWRQQIRDPEP